VVNKLIIGLCLSILLVLTLVSVVVGSSFTDSLVQSNIDQEVLIDGGSKTFEISGTDIIFNIDPIVGALVILIAVIGFAILIGIQVLGSGISPESIRIIINCTLYAGIWGILSVLSSPLIISIEVFGSLIYISLTIGYVIGIVQKLGGGT